MPSVSRYVPTVYISRLAESTLHTTAPCDTDTVLRRARRQPPPGKFESPYPTAISQVSERGWELVDHVVWLGWARDGQPLTVEAEAGFRTDLASVPDWLWSLFPPYGRYTAAVIIHDRLWRMAAAGEISYAEADWQLRQMLMVCGESWLRSGMMWAAVRWDSMLEKSGGREGWRRDAWPVLGFSVVALPFVALPVIVNVTHGLAFKLAERITG